jgi:lactoylglutathione lyase
MTPRVAHITIYGRDLQRMIEFYCDTLGFPLLTADETFNFARLDGGSVAIGLAAGEPNPELGIHVGVHTGIGLSVPDVDAAYEALKAKGVTFSVAPKRQAWGGRRAMLLDPDANVILLMPASEAER